MPSSPFITAFKQLLPPATILPAPHPRASVALILRPSNPAPLDVLLLQRSPRASDPWSAHIALPGGRREPTDPDDLSTAIREAREELGLDLSSPRYALLGRLHDRPITRATRKEGVLSTFLFLQLVPDRITPQPQEVASSFWVSLRHLHTHSPLFCTHPVHVPYQGDTVLAALLSGLRSILGLSNLRMPALDVLPHGKDPVKAVDAPHAVLWGMTLDIVGDLVEILGLTRVDRPRVLPESLVLASILCALARAQCLIKKLFWRRPRLDFMLSTEIA